MRHSRAGSHQTVRIPETEKDQGFLLAAKCEDAEQRRPIYTRFKPGTVDVVRQLEIDRTLNHHTGGLYGDDRGWTPGLRLSTNTSAPTD
jgi:hypothetical protein